MISKRYLPSVLITLTVGVNLSTLLCAAISAQESPSCYCDPSVELTRFTYEDVKMAVPIRILLYAENQETADKATEAALARFDELNEIMSDYTEESEVRRLCAVAGSGEMTPVSDDLWRVMRQAFELTESSGGTFDPTISPVVRLWRRARRLKHLPRVELMQEALALVGPELVRFDEEQQAIELLKQDMRIDLGGIAKGDAIDQALAVIREHGINIALVDAGGDVGMGDPPPNRTGWTIGVAALERDDPPSFYLSLSNCSIATSGDTWQYVLIEGKRYSHLVDPRTGMGLTDHSNVSIIAPDAITADGLASAVSIMGPEEGLELIESTPDTAAYIIRSPDGDAEIYSSSRWTEYPVVELPSDNESTDKDD
jgi:FAD:protein FMN transferase